jgi:hypothetical protein
MDFFSPLSRLGDAGAVLLLAFFFASLIVSVTLWVTLPFAVFGARSLLRELVRAQEESNRLLGDIRIGLEELRVERARPEPLGPGSPQDPDP